MVTAPRGEECTDEGEVGEVGAGFVRACRPRVERREAAAGRALWIARRMDRSRSKSPTVGRGRVGRRACKEGYKTIMGAGWRGRVINGYGKGGADKGGDHQTRRAP